VPVGGSHYYYSVGVGGYYPYAAHGFHFSFGIGYGGGWYAPYYGFYGYAPYYGYGPYYAYPYYGYPYFAYPYYFPGPMYGISTSYQSSGSAAEHHDEAVTQTPDVPTGSLRLRASPSSAKVYVDGALAGTVDDFDGLGGHLKIPVGTHELELRADGYRSWTTQVTIDAGKTRTERASLKKN